MAANAIAAFAHDSPFVDDVTWVSCALDTLSPVMRATEITNVGQVQRYRQRVWAISPSFYEVLGTTYLQADTADTHLPFSASEQLYSPKGVLSAIMGTFYQSALTLGPFANVFSLALSYNTQPLPSRQSFVMQPLMFARSMPVHSMSVLPNTRQEMVISMPKLLNLTHGEPRYNSLADIPLGAVYIRLRADISVADYRSVLHSVSSLTTYEYVADIRELLSGSNQARAAMDVLFSVVTVLVMVIAFFSLNTSMYVNIIEQAREIGVMRALGFSRPAVLRLYFYEAMILTLSSAVLGVCVVQAPA